ncbi:MAG TPA: copper amine oxidase N-terminal domain-containing protein, partial [Caldisericia bacterium]|nr:copper amine oxidase N-terminal domain-containing protein [Caldisericia bacterium]
NAKIVFTGEKLRSKNIVEVWVSKKTARINGQEKTLVQAPYIKNNLTMVPLRLVSEGLGLEVSWVPEVKTIIINLFSGWYLRLIIGYKKALIERPDGGIDELQAQSPPEIISGTTFVPLRLVGDALSRGGSKINIAWKGKNRKATITRSLKTGK